MKTCQNCKTRSKDDVVECIHCGTAFGDIPQPQDADEISPTENENAVKQTLFGIPAQKLEDLLAARDTDEGEDLSKRTIAGFNISGLFGEQEESEPSEKNEDEEDEEIEDIPQIIHSAKPQQTITGLNVSDLFNDPEPAIDTEKQTKNEKQLREKQTQNVEETQHDKETQNEIEKKMPAEPKFGTMLGINVADIMAMSAEAGAQESGPTKTLFSLPAVEATQKGQAPKPAGPKIKTDTAAGGVSAAVKPALESESESEDGFRERTPSKVSLGSLIPKVALQKKEKAPVLDAARPTIKTPIEFAEEIDAPPENKDKVTSSGIIRKSKQNRSVSKGESKKKVVGSYVVNKESLNSEETSVPHDSSREFPKVESIEEPSVEISDIALVESPEPAKTAKLEDVPVKTDKDKDKDKDKDTDSDTEKPEPSDEPVVSSHVDVPKQAIETKAKEPTKASGNYEGSIGKVQLFFVIAGALIILGAIAALVSKDLKSTFNLVSMGIAVLTLLGSVFVLIGSKNDVLKGSIWTICALVLFVIGIIGAVLGTPLAILFAFAGALFLVSALFPKIVSLL